MLAYNVWDDFPRAVSIQFKWKYFKKCWNVLAVNASHPYFRWICQYWMWWHLYLIHWNWIMWFSMKNLSCIIGTIITIYWLRCFPHIVGSIRKIWPIFFFGEAYVRERYNIQCTYKSALNAYHFEISHNHCVSVYNDDVRKKLKNGLLFFVCKALQNGKLYVSVFWLYQLSSNILEMETEVIIQYRIHLLNTLCKLILAFCVAQFKAWFFIKFTLVLRIHFFFRFRKKFFLVHWLAVVSWEINTLFTEAI